MKLFNKYEKGDYEYASYNKIRSVIVTVLMYALSAAVYIIGYITTGSNKNLLTIVAILGVLPASKALIAAIMSIRVKTADEDIRRKIEDNMGDLTGLYNLYLTSYDMNFYLAHATITGDSLICYTDSPDFDQKRFNDHIEKHMKIEGLQNVLIKVFTNPEAYITRLKQLCETGQSDKTNEKLINLLKNISV